MVSIFLLYFCSEKIGVFLRLMIFCKRNRKITGMNRNFTPCNDAPDALTGNAAARFGIALSKADNSLSISELRGGGVNPLFTAHYAFVKTFFHFPHTKAVSNSGWVRLLPFRAFAPFLWRNPIKSGRSTI